jgi:nucleoside-diphosphate-sugar epimerase
MKILITGASGFIGKHLVDNLQQFHEIVGVDQNESELNGQKIWSLNLLNKDEIINFCKNRKFDVIVHLAAQVPPSFNSPESVVSQKNNLMMTQNLLEAFRDYKIGQFIFASGISVLGEDINGSIDELMLANPSNAYTRGKYECELLSQKFETPEQKVTILRISAPYGPGQSEHVLISKFLKKAINNEDLTIFGSGNRSQDFIFIDDVSLAIKCAITSKANGIYNIASGRSASVNDLAQMILKVVPESKSKIVHLDQLDPQENYRPIVNTQKAEKDLNFMAKVGLDEGLRRMREIL